MNNDTLTSSCTVTPSTNGEKQWPTFLTIWRVDDGLHINISLDPLAPNGFTRRPITPLGHDISIKVLGLIDPITRDGDKLLIQDVFWEDDVKTYSCNSSK